MTLAHKIEQPTGYIHVVIYPSYGSRVQLGPARTWQDSYYDKNVVMEDREIRGKKGPSIPEEINMATLKKYQREGRMDEYLEVQEQTRLAKLRKLGIKV